MAGDVRGRAEPLHDRRFGSILPDIRQNTPKTAITDGSDRDTRGERGPDLHHNPRRPLDQAVPGVPHHRPAGRQKITNQPRRVAPPPTLQDPQRPPTPRLPRSPTAHTVTEYLPAGQR